MSPVIRFNNNRCFEQLSLLHVTAFKFRDIRKNMSVPIRRILSVILSCGRSSVRVGIDCQPPKTAIMKKRESDRAVEQATADRQKTKSNLRIPDDISHKSSRY